MFASIVRLARQPALGVLLALLLAGGLAFFRLSRADIQTDAGHYSLRGIGYLDFLATPRQGTPFLWYEGLPPFWTKLSFHDHPPVVFLIQHLFFLVFGVSDTAARLPFAVAGVLSVWLVYAIGAAVLNRSAGTVAAAGLAVATFFTWSSRVGYLEGVENAFILLAVWLFLRALRDERWFTPWGAGLALAVLAKYSALFLVPTFAGYLFAAQRQAFRRRNFLFGCGIFLLLLVPLGYYNWQLFKLRGHFDVQLSGFIPSMFAAAHRDWPLLFSTPPMFTPLVNLRDLTRSLRLAFSLPFAAALAVGLLGLIFRTLQDWRRRSLLLAFGCVSLLAVFTLKAPELRYLPITVPWIILGAVVGWRHWWESLPLPWRARSLAPLMAAAIGVGAVELAFNFNTNHAMRPRGQVGWHYAAYREGNAGFSQLGSYLRARLAENPMFNPRPVVPPSSHAVQTVAIDRGEDIIIFDAGLRWFSAVWYLQRYFVYHGTLVLHEQDLFNLKLQDWPQRFSQGGVRHVYFVVGRTPAVYDPWAVQQWDRTEAQRIARNIAKRMADGAPGAVTTINDGLGKPAFTVYDVHLNP